MISHLVLYLLWNVCEQAILFYIMLEYTSCTCMCDGALRWSSSETRPAIYAGVCEAHRIVIPPLALHYNVKQAS